MRSRFLRALLVLVVVLVVIISLLVILADPAEQKGPFRDGPPRPWVIAHHGGDGTWPVDTVFALENAIDLGVDVLEMDVHGTVDGVLVLMHDGTKLLVPSFVWLEAIHSPHAQVVQTPEEYFGMTVLRQRTVDAAHNRGMEMHAWTINETEDMERLLALGLDGIITDRPDRMLELLAR